MEHELRSLPDVVDGIRTAVLVLDGPSGLSGRPLAVQRVDGDAVWFLVGDDAPWLDEASGAANVVFSSEDVWASVSGRAWVSTDPVTIEELGDPVSDTWFNEGRDPVAVRVDVERGDWWTSPGKVATAVQVAKAKLTHQEPDVGTRGELT